MSSEQKKNQEDQYKFVNDLPYVVLRRLGILLDYNDQWKILGGEYMKFDRYKLHRIGQAVIRRESPSEDLLTLWGNENNKISLLFRFLAKMKHYKAMTELKPFVDKKLHYLFEEGPSRIESMLLVTVKPPTEMDAEDAGSNKGEVEPKKNGTLANQNSRKKDEIEKTLNPIDFKELGSGLAFLNYGVLTESTNFWSRSNKLGSGGFGDVYKGVVKQTPMAIKRLKRRKGNEMAFNALEAQLRDLFKELKYLNSNRHDNILALYGYSYEDGNFCLVSQFMPNGSLEDRLLCRDNTLPLSALIRCYIARGTARGLQFLHDREKPLVHGDIKSANILLDRSFEPKIGDFGLSREGPTANYSYVQVSHVHGTKPYLPPEFLRSKKFSTKVDTYSFGVVLFEIITGLRAYDVKRSEKFLTEYVLKLSEENNIHRVIDPKIGFEYFALFASYVFTLGKECVSYRPKTRPTMMDVSRSLDHLNSHMTTIQFQRPVDFYIDPSRRSNLASSAASSAAKAGLLQHPNVNNQQNYRRIPSPTKPVDAAPALWNVRKKSHAEQLAVKVASRLEAPSLTKDTKNDPVHAYYYLSSAGLKINPKSTKTEVTMLNSDSKSDPTDQRDKEHGEAIPLLDHFSEEKSPEELPFITQLQK